MIFKSLCGLVVKVDMSFSSCNLIQGVIGGIVQVKFSKFNLNPF